MSEAMMIKTLRDDPGMIDENHGVPIYKYMNGNLVSVIQRHTIHTLILSLVRQIFQEPIKSLTIGGPPEEFLSDIMEGVDICVGSKHSLKEEGRNNKVYLPGYDGTRIPEKNDTYHVVESCHSLEHLIDPKTSILEAHRVLKPKGFFVLTVPDKTHHTHNMSDHQLGHRCFNEWTPKECMDELFFPLIKEKRLFSLIQFNTKNNKLDFDIILQKL